MAEPTEKQILFLREKGISEDTIKKLDKKQATSMISEIVRKLNLDNPKQTQIQKQAEENTARILRTARYIISKEYGVDADYQAESYALAPVMDMLRKEEIRLESKQDRRKLVTR